jgi:hypothetical protein
LRSGAWARGRVADGHSTLGAALIFVGGATFVTALAWRLHGREGGAEGFMAFIGDFFTRGP